MKKKVKLKDGVQIIGLAGYKGSGKDTLGNHLVSEINNKGDRYAVRVGFADALKEYCAERYNMDRDILYADQHKKDTTLSELLWTDFDDEVQKRYERSRVDTKFLTYREVLQVVGTDVFREEDGTIWIDKLTEHVNTIESELPLTVVITDLRFDNEALWVMENDGHVIRIMSDLQKTDVHTSEFGVTMYNFEVLGKGKSSLKHSKKDVYELYRYILLYERVRDYEEETEGNY